MVIIATKQQSFDVSENKKRGANAEKLYESFTWLLQFSASD